MPELASRKGGPPTTDHICRNVSVLFSTRSVNCRCNRRQAAAVRCTRVCAGGDIMVTVTLNKAAWASGVGIVLVRNQLPFVKACTCFPEKKKVLSRNTSCSCTMSKQLKPIIKSETGASSATSDAAASPAELTSNSVYVSQKECIPTVKRTKHETEAVLSASLGIAATPSAIPSVFTGTRKLQKPIIKYENTESSSAHFEAELDHGPLAVVSSPQSVLPAAAAALQEAGVEAAHGRLGIAQRAERAPPPDPRAWSAAAAETCSIYTVRACLGDPDASLPSWIKTLNKSQLQGMMQSSGFSDISGTKHALLHRFQTGVPFVEYRIDGRECLQRMLVVCLHAWGRNDMHAFRATMPARGDCPWGAKRLGDLECLQRSCHPDINKGSFSDEFRSFSSHWEPPETWIKWNLQICGPSSGAYRNPNPAVDRATLEALIAGHLTLDDPAPFRTVSGVGFEPGAMRRVLGPYAMLSDDVGGALSLEECDLAAGDRISMLYDFGEQNTIVFKVVAVERDQALLPEVPFLRHMTRALLGRSGGASTRVRRQYHVSSSDSDASDNGASDDGASDGDANELGLDAASDTP
jgi:hypothetical protein